MIFLIDEYIGRRKDCSGATSTLPGAASLKLLMPTKPWWDNFFSHVWGRIAYLSTGAEKKNEMYQKMPVMVAEIHSPGSKIDTL